MADGTGWQPLRLRSALDPQLRFAVAPFTRLARVQALSSSAEAMVVVALAGSLFFSIDPSQARWRVALYLVLTLAPFAVVAPLLGPVIDRAGGGAKWLLVATSAVRVLACAFMVGHLATLWLFPEAFVALVMGKAFHVAKNSYVPQTVTGPGELVAANSKLAILSGLAASCGGLPAIAAARFASPAWAMGLAAVAFAVTTGFSLRLPTKIAAPSARDGQDVGDPDPGSVAQAGRPVDSSVLLAASAMGLIRGLVGFVAFLLAFAIRASNAGTTGYAVIVGSTVLGGLVGAATAPKLRKVLPEQQLLLVALVAVAVAGVVGAVVAGLAGSAIVASVLAIGSATAKLAFDALVQQAPSVPNKGRAFAQFEARFQILWVLGAFEIGRASCRERVCLAV